LTSIWPVELQPAKLKAAAIVMAASEFRKLMIGLHIVVVVAGLHRHAIWPRVLFDVTARFSVTGL
jgi:hypothetical protein